MQANHDLNTQLLQNILRDASRLPMERALSLIAQQLLDLKQLEWDGIDAILIQYKENRELVTPNFIKTMYLLFPEDRTLKDDLVR